MIYYYKIHTLAYESIETNYGCLSLTNIYKEFAIRLILG
jgi:hypothetical protein